MKERERSDQEATYDERVQEILRGLMEGRTREEIAEDYDYTNYKSLDMYMRRRNFQWNGESYEPKGSRLDKIRGEISSDIPLKAERIIKSLEQGPQDLRTLAQEEGFEDHRELGAYMEEYDLYWEGDQGNYEYRPKIEVVEGKESSEEEVEKQRQNTRERKLDKDTSSSGHKNHEREEFLDLLYEHKDKLLDLLLVGNQNIPKYAVPGTGTTKSIYMSDLLARLITDYSEVKNISQRDIVQTAIIEYLSKYGYETEVKQLMSKK